MGVRLREDTKTVNAGQLKDVHQHERTANGGWKKIDWKRAEETVNRIQIRIVKAVMQQNDCCATHKERRYECLSVVR